MHKAKDLKSKVVVIISMLLVLIVVATTNYVNVYAEPKVNSGSYIVMSGSTSEVVYEQHADRKLPIGNITKLMTAMVLIDNIRDDAEYQNKVEINSEIAKYGDEFKKDDYVSVEELLRVMLVTGSDEAAMALADYSGDSIKNFVGNMNSKAMEIGLLDTNFDNPTGRYAVEHYSTAQECALITQNAIRYDRIKRTLLEDSIRVKYTNGKIKKSKAFTNSNPLLSSVKKEDIYSYANGGMFGTLQDPATYSQFACAATKDDMQLIVVMLEAKENTIARDAKELFDYGFKHVTKKVLIKKGECAGKVLVKGGAQTRVKGYTEINGYVYVPPEGSEDLVRTEVVTYEGLKAPLEQGQKVGEYQIYVADELKGTVDLVCKKAVKKGWFPSQIYISNLAVTIFCSIVLILLIVILRLRMVNKRKAKMRARNKQTRIREIAITQEKLDADRKSRKWTYSNFYDDKDLNDKL